MEFNVADLEILKDSALKSFAEGVATADPDVCWEFNLEVGRLESRVLQLYGMAALIAKREPDVAKVAELWRGMVDVCDAIAEKISELCKEHPYCMASHDKILDVRNKCARLAELHS
jgi:hypothetical protein